MRHKNLTIFEQPRSLNLLAQNVPICRKTFQVQASGQTTHVLKKAR